MKNSRFLAGVYRRMLVIGGGGSLYILSDCDDEVRATVLTEMGAAATGLITGLINALVGSAAG